MVAAGFVVGLGNVWRLPVMAGEHGGGAFWLIYVLVMLFIGVPLLTAELLVGLHGRSNPVKAVRGLAKDSQISRGWAVLAWLACFSGLLLLPLYGLVGGWSAAFMHYAWVGELTELEVAETAAIFSRHIGDIHSNVAYSGGVVLVATLISSLGINYGLGLIARFLVPFALALVVGVAWLSQYYGDMDQALAFLFKVDWEAMDARTPVYAVAQVLFTLTLGAGVMMALGAYVPSRRDLPLAASSIVLTDVAAAAMFGYVLLPLIFASNLAPDGGSGLLFVSMPAAFGNVIYGTEMTAALYLAVTLFVVMSIAALMEPLVAVVNEQWHLRRPLAAFAIGSLAWAGAVMVAEFFAIGEGLFGLGEVNLMAALDRLSQVLLPLVSLWTVLFLGWFVSQKLIYIELSAFPQPLVRLWTLTMRWVALPGIVLVLVVAVYDKIAPNL